MQAADSPVEATSARGFAPRRSTDREIACAIRLGWRVAELYSLRTGELSSSPGDNVLPLRTSLPPTARLRLELRAAAGDAERAGVPLDPDELSELLDLACRAPGSGDAEQDLRARIETWHIGLVTALWAEDVGIGEAYELGSFLSDTWNRVVLAMRREGDADALVADELLAVFSEERVQRIKVLLDDLQARIDPAAVRIVQQHLASWRSQVREHVAENGVTRLPFAATWSQLQPLASQTVIWRQLVTGEKEPEGYIGRDARAKVRDTMVKRMLTGYRLKWKSVVVGAAVTAAFVLGVGQLAKLLEGAELAPLIAFGGSLAGAFGLKITSIAVTMRRSLDARAELIWNAALVEVICEQTLRVADIFGPPNATRERTPRTPLVKLNDHGGRVASASGAARAQRRAA
ncbi:MAG: hypothetical protein QOJ85_861 [Solirubrobacteraceae bacterium]|jgi:hypothetical protein|nr:hypothetical protein [Solirubrobacteraceae bacterium]